MPTRVRDRTLAQAKITPVEVMVKTMELRWAESLAADPETKRELQEAACDVAAQVAPYLHPRLTAAKISGDAANPIELALSLRSPDDLRRLVRGQA